MKSKKCAVIGVGGMGQNHARLYSELADLVAVADLDTERGRSIAQQYGARFYQSHQKMLANEKLDAISVVVPTKHHFAVVLDCLAEGIATLVEKPITNDVQKAHELREKATKTNTPLMVGHVERFNAAVVALKEIVDSGELGKIINLLAIRVGINPPAVSPADISLDLGIHDVDVFSYLLEEKPLEAQVIKKQIYPQNNADSAAITLNYPNATALITTNWVTPLKIRKLHVTGLKGYVEIDYIKQSLEIFKKTRQEKKTEGFAELTSLANLKKERVPVQKNEPLRSELTYFLRQAKTDQTKSFLDDAILALELLHQPTTA